MKCKVEGCEKGAKYKGKICSMHYARKRANGTYDLVPKPRKKRKTDPQKFHRNYVKDEETGCWMWTGGVESHGYGRMSFNGKRYKAHQLSWILHHGEIQDGLCVCHKCDTPGCVSPDHLFLGTMSDNMRDKVKKGRQSHKGYANHEEFLEKCRSVYVMKKETGWTQNQVAEHVGESPNTVNWRLYTWRKHLRQNAKGQQRYTAESAVSFQ